MGFDSEDVRFVMCFHGAVEVSSDGFHKDIRRFDASDKENCYIGQKYLVNPELRWDLQVRAAHAFMPSFIAVWLGASDNCVLWVITSDTFKEVMPENSIEYLKGRMSLQDTEYSFADLQYLKEIGVGGFGVVTMV